MNNLAGLVSKSNKAEKQNLIGFEKLKIKSINNFGKLTQNLNRQQAIKKAATTIKQRNSAQTIQNAYRNHLENQANMLAPEPTDLFGAAGGTRTGARYQPTPAMQRIAEHRKANPDLHKAMNKLQDIKRGRQSASPQEVQRLEESIKEMQAKNEAVRQAGGGKKLGRPAGIQGAKSRSDKGKQRGPPTNPPKKK